MHPPAEYWLNATQHDAGTRLNPEEMQNLARELDATADKVKQILERATGLESVLHPAALDEERIGIRVDKPVREELRNELEELRHGSRPHDQDHPDNESRDDGPGDHCRAHLAENACD